MGGTALFLDPNILKRQYGLKRFVLWSTFSKKNLWIEPYCFLIKNFLKDNVG